MLKTIRLKSSTGLLSTGAGNSTYLISTKNSIVIDWLIIIEGRAIKEVSVDGNEIDEIGIVDPNRIAKSKDLITTKVSFLISKARLPFLVLK